MTSQPGRSDTSPGANRAARGGLAPKASAIALRITGAPWASSWRQRRAHQTKFRPTLAAALLIGASASAVILLVAEFMTLYAVRMVHGSASVPPVSAGTENYYGLIPIGLLSVALVVAAIRLGDRWALIAVAILALVALYIVLLHDLPDARRTGLVKAVHGGLAEGASSPKIGMYMETLGALLLLLTAGLGLLFGEPATAQAVPGAAGQRATKEV